MKDRAKGILIIFLGILCVSPDAVLVRFLTEGGSDPWTIIFWKLLLSIPWSGSYAIYEAGGIRALWKSMTVVGRWYYAAAIPVQASVDICFVFAFVYTSAANALLLVNLNPLWCAVIGRIFLGDILPRRTIIALVLALCCILIIFVPEVVQRRRNEEEEEDGVQVQEEADEQPGDSSAKGNVVALLAGFGLAAYITIVRKGGMSSKNINLIGAAALGAALSSIISVIVRRGDVMPISFWSAEILWQFWLAVVAQGFGIGAVFIAISIAPRLITGAEIGMVVLLEVLLGPLFVWIAYRDPISKPTLIGGSLLLVVLAVHESRPLLEKAKDVHRSLSRKISSRMGSAIGSKADETKEVEDVCDVPLEKEDEAAVAHEEGAAAGPTAQRLDTCDETEDYTEC